MHLLGSIAAGAVEQLASWLTVSTAYAANFDMAAALEGGQEGFNAGVMRWVFFGLVAATFIISTLLKKRRDRKEAAKRATGENDDGAEK